MKACTATHTVNGSVHARCGRRSALLNGGSSGRRSMREGVRMEPFKGEEARCVSGKYRR